MRKLLITLTLFIFIPIIKAESIPTPYIMESPSVNSTNEVVLFEVTDDTPVKFNNLTKTDKSNVVNEYPTEYTITYKLNGGKNNKKNPDLYTSIDQVVLAKPTKTGYIFSGWYKDAKFKKKITTIKKGSKGNITLYAKWTPIKYNIKYNANGGKGKMSSKKNLKYNKSYKLANNKFTKKGYKFVGWTLNKKGTGKVYKNKSYIKNLTTKNKNTVTLYAKWKKR